MQLDRRGHLVFSSDLGGGGDDFGSVSVLDSNGNLYAGGWTTSRDFPVTPNAIQPTFRGGDIDGLLVKISLRHEHEESESPDTEADDGQP